MNEKEKIHVPVEAWASPKEFLSFINETLAEVSHIDPVKLMHEMRIRYTLMNAISFLRGKNEAFADSIINEPEIRQKLFIDTILLQLRYILDPKNFEIREEFLKEAGIVIKIAQINKDELLNNKELQDIIKRTISLIKKVHGVDKAMETYDVIGQTFPIVDVSDLFSNKEKKQYVKDGITSELSRGTKTGFDKARKMLNQYGELLTKNDLKSIAKWVVSKWFDLYGGNARSINNILESDAIDELCDLCDIKLEDILSAKIIKGIKKLIFKQEILPRQRQGFDIYAAVELVKSHITVDDIVGSIKVMGDESIGYYLDGLDSMSWLLQLADEIGVIDQLRDVDGVVSSIYLFIWDLLVEYNVHNQFLAGDIGLDSLNVGGELISILNMIGKTEKDLLSHIRENF